MLSVFHPRLDAEVVSQPPVIGGKYILVESAKIGSAGVVGALSSWHDVRKTSIPERSSIFFIYVKLHKSVSTNGDWLCYFSKINYARPLPDLTCISRCGNGI